MNNRTDLKIGQRVWFIENNQICSDTIKRIKIEISTDKISTYYYLNPGEGFGSDYRWFSSLFKSEKALLKSLSDSKWDKK